MAIYVSGIEAVAGGGAVSHEGGDTSEASTPSTGGTIPTFGIQLAYWLGCNPIVLLGVDADDRGHAYDPVDGGKRMHQAAQDILVAEVDAFEKSLRERGVVLVNGSLGGRLTIPRVNIADVLGD